MRRACRGRSRNWPGRWSSDLPKYFEDYSDERNKGSCIHCGASLSQSKKSKDHTPSKILLDAPYPMNLAVTEVCGPCNNGFSKDEEYLVSFLSAVLSGSTDPEIQVIPQASKIFRHAHALRKMIDATKERQASLFGGDDLVWHPDLERVRNVILKNARAHLYFENGEPMFGDPEVLSIVPVQSMLHEETEQFFSRGYEIEPWCEVGSRWNARLVGDVDFDADGFLVVQPGVYRFRIEAGGLGIKSVIREYLATSVFW